LARGNESCSRRREYIKEKFAKKLGEGLPLEEENVKILYSSEKVSLKNTFENSYPKKT
jgi:hypothetical protein